MAGCPVCGTTGPGDPSVGIFEDEGICPRCAKEGYSEGRDGSCPCYYDPAGELHECANHEGSAAEEAYEDSLSAFYGGSGPVTIDEQCAEAWKQKRALR